MDLDSDENYSPYWETDEFVYNNTKFEIINPIKRIK